jgi:hypothetical protein
VLVDAAKSADTGIRTGGRLRRVVVKQGDGRGSRDHDDRTTMAIGRGGTVVAAATTDPPRAPNPNRDRRLRI